MGLWIPAKKAISDLVQEGLGFISWSCPPETGAAAASAPTAGTIYSRLLPLRAGQVVTNLRWYISVVGAGTVPTSLVVGLADSTGKIVAVSNELKANAGWTTLGINDFPLSAAYTVPTTGSYYAVVLQVGSWGTTQHTMNRSTGGFTQIGTKFACATHGTGKTALPAVNSSLDAFSTSGALVYFAGAS